MQLVKKGNVSESRIDVSVKRLREKFLLGLFENPFVDPKTARSIVGNNYFVRFGQDAQRKTYILLINKNKLLPFKGPRVSTSTKFYIEGFNVTTLENRNFLVVKTPKKADYALFRLQALYEPRPGGFESRFHIGSLEFNATKKARQVAIYKTVPTVVDIILNRPAAILKVAKGAAAVFGNFGNGTEAFLDIIFGITAPEGKLPFDLPRSQKAVEKLMENVPFNTKNPIFKFGYSLRYNDKYFI
ncbi:hypothetical protein MCOR04_008378 [Pyricularia oryzae]|nr:hypothetical protein MCOR04_008378 [Pyricularia oryzae]